MLMLFCISFVLYFCLIPIVSTSIEKYSFGINCDFVHQFNSSFVLSLNVRMDTCVLKCVNRPWCVGVMYSRKHKICYILFEADAMIVITANTTSSNNNPSYCVVVEKSHVSPELKQVRQVGNEIMVKHYQTFSNIL